MPFDPARSLAIAKNRSRLILAVLGFISLIVSLLMLTGPLYMLQIYDRVLVSGATETLILLTVLAGGAFLTFAALDTCRLQAGRRFGIWLESFLFEPAMKAAARTDDPERPHQDLSQVREAFQSPALFGVMDLPFAPVFLVAMAFLHPWLGIYGTVAALILAGVTILNARLVAKTQQTTAASSAQITRQAEGFLNNRRMLRAMGLEAGLLTKMDTARQDARGPLATTLDGSSRLTGLSRFLRYTLQSGVLGIGALLVLRGEMGAGAMIAGSILLGRALAPADQALAGMHTLLQGRRAWMRVANLLKTAAGEVVRERLPDPPANLKLARVAVMLSKEKVLLRDIAVELHPSEVVAVVGPSGAGKTTLLDVMAGVRKPTLGSIELGDAPLELYPDEQRAELIGYVPQQLSLLPGSVADNIARLATEPDREAVFAAADLAGATQLISQLTDGFETVLDSNGAPLSAGQRQQIAIARALYKNPPVVILDEPHAHLDAAGTQAFERMMAARREAGAVTVMAVHDFRLAALADRILVVRGGQLIADGPSKEIIAKLRQPPRKVA